MTEEEVDPWLFGDVRIGRCTLCKQELLLTNDDCWHPHNVQVACPIEPSNGYVWIKWAMAGNRTGRPGEGYWEPIPDQAFRISGTDFRRGEYGYLGQIVTEDEAREEGFRVRVSSSGNRQSISAKNTGDFSSRGFSGYLFTPPEPSDVTLARMPNSRCGRCSLEYLGLNSSDICICGPNIPCGFCRQGIDGPPEMPEGDDPRAGKGIPNTMSRWMGT